MRMVFGFGGEGGLQQVREEGQKPGCTSPGAMFPELPVQSGALCQVALHSSLRLP